MTSVQLLSSDFIYHNSNSTVTKSNLEEIPRVWKTYVRVVCYSMVWIWPTFNALAGKELNKPKACQNPLTMFCYVQRWRQKQELSASLCVLYPILNQAVEYETVGFDLVKANLMHNFFLVRLFLFSTCFGRLCAHHQEKQLYLCDTWYFLFCMDGGHIVAHNMYRK